MGRKKISTAKRSLHHPVQARATTIHFGGRTYAKSIFTSIDWSESYISLLLGLTVVIVAAVLFLIIAKERNIHVPRFSSVTKATSSIATVNTRHVLGSATSGPNGKITGNSYTVQDGDDLYDIALRAYGDGDRWVDLAQANVLDYPDFLYAGQIIKIPR